MREIIEISVMSVSWLMHKALSIFGERIALFPVILAFISVFFLQSSHQVFSQTNYKEGGYTLDGLTYDFTVGKSAYTFIFTKDPIENIEHKKFEKYSRLPEITPTPTTAPNIIAALSVSVTPVPEDVWEQIALCESGGNWSINTGNGYYGGLQFSQGAWNSVGGVGLPSDASREEQILRGKLLQEKRGWGVWGLCAQKLGLS